jgi:tetratricopeptide (TPR) repeat protein
MSGRYRLFAVVLFPFLRGPLAAADPWVKLTTPNFELYTSAGEKKGREAILYFEQVRSFFLQGSVSKRVSEFPVRIVAFRGEKQYHPYRLNEFAFAYYTRGRNRDYIVMQDIVSEHYPAAIHEYTHLILEHTGQTPPPWLNEGLAELYSTLKPVGKKAAVGDIIPGRAQTLLSSKWIGLDALTSADHQSPLYNERDRAGMFYAESWVLTHMLFFAPNYRPNFPKFIVAASSGKSADEACQSAFGKHLWEVEADLRQYIKGERFYRAMFDIKLEKSAEDPDVSEASAFESGMVLADLLALTSKTQQALSAYQELAKSNPEQPEVEESLGYLAWQSGDHEAARGHFERALAAGTRNARMCYDYAMLSRNGNDAVKNALPAFQKALELKPDYAEARLQFGLMLVNTRNYPEAIAQLRQVKKVDPEQAQWYFPALAFAYLQTGDKEKARENAESAKKWAKTPQQMEHADSLLRSLETRKISAEAVPPAEQHPHIQRTERSEFTVIEQAPPANPFVGKEDKMNRVDGIAQRLDCSGKAARFHVLVGKAQMIFAIPDPGRVLIKHTGELKHDFACGVQKPYKESVDYAILPDSKSGTAGIVRGLEF